MSADAYEEVGGVEWCRTHHGIVDECSNHTDDDGEPCCDMWDDGDESCDIVTLYVKAVAS